MNTFYRQKFFQRCVVLFLSNGPIIESQNKRNKFQLVPDHKEAFALGNSPGKAFLDGLGNAFGYGIILIIVAFFRELLGSGTLFGSQIIPLNWYIENGGFYSNNGMMILPPMALITVGILIWWQRSRNEKLIEDN